MKTLKDIELHRHYDPANQESEADSVECFYNSCLSVSNRYDRISAYFNSAVLKSFAQGLHSFCRNNGKIRFIFSCQLSKEDMLQIQEGYEKRMDVLASTLRESAPLLKNDFEICNLSYLIEHHIADVKIAFMLEDQASICHIKAGLFKDGEGNKVYFEGSGNETISGTMRNAENYTVACSFKSEEQNQDVLFGENKFDRIWNNTYSQTVFTEYPLGKLYEQLISFSKGKIFNSNQELFMNEDVVVIDIDKKNKWIILNDFTFNHLLSVPMRMKTFFVSYWQILSENCYAVKKLTLHDLRDGVVGRLSKQGIRYILTNEAQEYLDSNNLELEKRFKLGLAIKENKYQAQWQDQYDEFSYIVNSEMVARLKPQQMRNTFFHYSMKSSADFSVPGTGKTYIAYGLFAFLSSKKVKKCSHLVVFGPINCFRAWKEEGLAIFGEKRSLSVFDIQQHLNDYSFVLSKQRFDVYLFNYDFLGNSSWKIEDKIKTLIQNVLDSETLVVFDEIHKLKSLTGITAQNFVRLINSSVNKPIYRLALTGTPLPNSFVDILNYLKILYTDDVYNTFANLTETSLKMADNNPDFANQIIDELLPVFVRTTKSELDVPPADEDDRISLKVFPTMAEAQLYELIWQSYDNPLLKYIRLIQASSNPVLLKEKIEAKELAFWFDSNEGDEYGKQLSEDDLCINSGQIKVLVDQIGASSKMKATLDKIIQLVQQGKKVLVWCLFIHTIDYIHDYLEHNGIYSTTITGALLPCERERRIGMFQNDDLMVLITNPNTLAESVSLHRVCHDAIYFEYGFNLTYLLQSKDRIHRVGLTPDIHTHYYFSITDDYEKGYGSIDNLILDMLQKKASRMISVIESGRLAIDGDSDNDIDAIRYIIAKGKYSK